MCCQPAIASKQLVFSMLCSCDPASEVSCKCLRFRFMVQNLEFLGLSSTKVRQHHAERLQAAMPSLQTVTV